MVRVRAAVAARAGSLELDRYLRERAWHWTVQRNYALAADYAIRLLNRHPRDPLGLVLGEVAGRHAGQPMFVDKCVEAQRRLCFIKDVPHVLDVLDATASAGSIPVADVRQLLQERQGEEEAKRTVGSVTPPTMGDAAEDERLFVKQSAPLADVAKLVHRACQRASSSTSSGSAAMDQLDPQRQHAARAEVLEPAHTTSGRGLYATRRLPSRTHILTDAPLLCQRYDPQRCSHCLQPLGSTGVASTTAAAAAVSVCPYCEDESYCGPACRDAAWAQYHACCCAAVNPTFASWAGAMRERLYHTNDSHCRDDDGEVSSAGRARSTTLGPGEEVVADAGSEVRAALACLAVAKVCAMATVAGCHPLALPGFSALRGTADYAPTTALSEIGAMAVTLSHALRQPRLFMEEVLSCFALLQTNEFLQPGGIALYPVLSLLNHSCEPNCALVSSQQLQGITGPSGARRGAERHLVTLREVRDGEQLMVDYNAALTTSLSYAQRQSLCAQRHFECFCPRCVRRQ